MSIADICSKDIVTVDHKASLREAAMLMRTHHVGALVVTADEATDPHVVGIVTDRDLAIEVIAQGVDVNSVPVGQLASRKIAAVAAEGSLGDAVMAMQKAGVRRLLVIEGEERLAGLVSSDDVFEALAGQLSTLSGALRAGIARESEQRPPAPPLQQRPIFRPHGTAGWQA